MTPEIAFVLAVTLAALIVLVREWIPADGVALFVVVVLVVGGALEPAAAVRALGDPAILTIGAMFVLAAGLTKTGAVEFVGRRLLAAGGNSEARLLAALMVTVAAISAFVNNTPLAVVFLPIVLGISERSGIAPSKLLIPMSYATIVGGMCTLIGTSTNVLVSDRLHSYDAPSIGMFEPLPLAAAGIAMTVVYMVLVGRRILPVRTTVSSTVRGGKIHDYVTEVVIPASSPLVGRPLDADLLARLPGLRVLQVIRGEAILRPVALTPILAAGDLLVVKGEVNALLALGRGNEVEVAPDLREDAPEARGKNATLAELIVLPGSSAIGQRVRDLALRARHGAVVLAVQRHETHLREKVADLVLRFGDVLLVQADAASLEGLHGSADFVVVEGVEGHVRFSNRAGLSIGVMVAVMGLAAAGIPGFPIWLLALAGALVMVAGGCVRVRDAYHSVDLRLLILIWGTISLGQAIESSGAASWLAHGVVGAARPMGDVAILSAVYLLTNVLTALVSNAASALVMLPIALATAAEAHLSGRPFVMAVMFAASIDFSTPIGYQTNLFVYGPGGYRFSDYVKVGVPLNLLWWGLATALIPVFWPLR